MAIDPVNLALYIDIFIATLAIVFALSTLPRALAHFSTTEWRHGHILRSIHLGSARLGGSKPAISYHQISQNPAPSNEKDLSPQSEGFAPSPGHGQIKDGFMSEEPHTLSQHSSTSP